MNGEEFRVHRFPVGGVIATDRIHDYFIAYHLNDLGSLRLRAHCLRSRHHPRGGNRRPPTKGHHHMHIQL